MTSSPGKFVAGNWKMHGLAASLAEARLVSESLVATPPHCRVALFPPAPLIHRMAEALAGGPVEIGAQDCHVAPKGAHTGDSSAEMLYDAGARLVILGHSERRSHHRESDRHIAEKVAAALRAGLEPVICVGESSDERRSGVALEVVGRQLQGSLPPALEGHAFCVAYEPVWAIGTGETPTQGQIEQAHLAIRRALQARFTNGAAIPILYGGSVNASNGMQILSAAGVDGALVGGASLSPADFLPIIHAASSLFGSSEND